MSLRIYLDLDSLFDTRLSVLKRIDHKLATTLVNAPMYDNRVFDEWPGVRNDTFLKAFIQRSIADLAEAGITRLVTLIADMVLLYPTIALAKGLYEKPVIHINTYGYDLLEEEIAVVVSSFSELLKGHATVTAINKPLAELQPSYLKDTYTIMFMYEYWKWLEHMAEHKVFEKETCSKVIMVGPSMYFEKDPKKNQPLNFDFTLVCTHASMMINLVLCPVWLYSISVDISRFTPNISNICKELCTAILEKSPILK